MVRSLPPLRALEHVAPVAAPSAGRAWATALLDLVFPPSCPVCRRRPDQGRRDPLCGPCWEALERIAPPVCRICGLPLGQFTGREPVGGEGPTCARCRRKRPAFTYARSATSYGDVAREAVHALKFGKQRALAAPLGDLVAALGTPDPPGAVIVIPVPLHPRRERERGFNQSRLLADRVARAWKVPARADVLARTSDTRPQAELSAEARRANVKGAFALRRPAAVRDRHVVLVDDILTTGSTASACARCLLDGGAASVGILTVTRAL
jgi:ComF family protein